MAKVELATPFDEISGKLSSNERIVMRTRYGRTEAYAYRHPYTGPISENRKPVIHAFSEAVKQCKTEMPDPDLPIGKNGIYSTINSLNATRRKPTSNSSAPTRTSITSPSGASSSHPFPSKSEHNNKNPASAHPCLFLHKHAYPCLNMPIPA